jgi:hypothetical protein
MIGISTDTIVRATLAMFHSPAYLQGQTSPPSIVQAERIWTPTLMQLLASRDYPVIDYQTMGEFVGRERLFRRLTAHSFCTCHRKGSSKRRNGSSG